MLIFWFHAYPVDSITGVGYGTGTIRFLYIGEKITTRRVVIFFMPKARRSAEDDEVARIIKYSRRSGALADSFRPSHPGPFSREHLSRGPGPRPGYGRTQYRGVDVPAYSACHSRTFTGVVERTMPSGVRHACFSCTVGGNHYLFNPNDSEEFRPSVPLDGFHTAEFDKYDRPMMERPSQIVLTWNSTLGECNEFAQNLSEFWHHGSHAGMNLQQRQRMLSYVIALCCSSVSTREWVQRLWQYAP